MDRYALNCGKNHKMVNSNKSAFRISSTTPRIARPNALAQRLLRQRVRVRLQITRLVTCRVQLHLCSAAHVHRRTVLALARCVCQLTVQRFRLFLRFVAAARAAFASVTAARTAGASFVNATFLERASASALPSAPTLARAARRLPSCSEMFTLLFAPPPRLRSRCPRPRRPCAAPKPHS